MKFTPELGFLLFFNLAAPSEIEDRFTSELGDALLPANKHYCQDTLEFFSNIKKAGNLNYKSGHLDISIALADIYDFGNDHKLDNFLFPTFSYVLAKWYNDKYLKQSDPIKVSLNFKNNTTYGLKGTRSYNIDPETISESYASKGKYHIMMSYVSTEGGTFYSTLNQIERDLEDWKTNTVKSCEEETGNNKPEGFCKVVLESDKPISELPDALIYHPAKFLSSTWSKC